MDYCINRNECTGRATKTCDGPEDHITSDPAFAEEGPGHCMDCQQAAKGYCKANEHSGDNAAAIIISLILVLLVLGAGVAGIICWYKYMQKCKEAELQARNSTQQGYPMAQSAALPAHQ